MVSDAVEQRAGEALAGEHRRPFLEGLDMPICYVDKSRSYVP